jgi:N-acetylglucosaminyl-diphospho-decaprenol L-rhamnosyltransferase
VVSNSDYELVAVSYHSGDNLRQLLGGLPDDIPVAIVDNARNADSVRELTEVRRNGRYVDSGGGKGYAKAANLGARTSTYDYLVFINPDSRPTAEVFGELVAELRGDPRLGAVSALLVEPSGRPEIGVGGWEPSISRAAVHAAGLHKLFPRRGIWARPKATEGIELDWLTGACMAVRRQTFLELGGFDERYFVYNEDMTFGRALRHSDYRQSLRTDLLVPHTGGGSGGSTNMARLRGASFVDYVRRHNSPFAAEMMRLSLLLGTWLRMCQRGLRRDRVGARMFWSYGVGLLCGTGILPSVPDNTSAGSTPSP